MTIHSLMNSLHSYVENSIVKVCWS